ncbi:hypothetical protein GGR50DRAFT_704306 [Xylaria sp. CBS 124048]|nr:hypothetical protein GGR50DRAFT_704306 [Xylaria sp. CBS 124048]
MLQSLVAIVSLLAAATHAHFTVQLPNPVGPLKEDDEGQSPCGGYTADLTTMATTDFHVGGDAIGSTSTHPTTNWLYRITTDPTASGNWTQIYNGIVQQTGAGEFCAKDVTIPPEFVGQKAILNIVGNGPDGLLFQCAAVNFVNGTASSTPSNCVNASKITATYGDDTALASLVGSASSNPSSTASSSPTNTPNAAPSLHNVAMGGLGTLLTTGAMVLAGVALMA